MTYVPREFVAMEAVAPIGALGVDTPPTATHCMVQALIYIWKQQK